MDINAGKLLSEISMKEATDELIDFFVQVADGQKTKAEANLQDAISILTVSSPF